MGRWRGEDTWERVVRRAVRRETGRGGVEVIPRRPERPSGRDDLARHIVRRYALRCGAVGAVTSVAGVPAAAATWMSALALQVRMILAVAEVYGQGPGSRDFETDVLLIMAGDAAKEVVKRAGVEASQQLAWRAAQSAVVPAVRQVGQWQVLVDRPWQRVAAARIVPLAGAPIGFGVDWAYARAVGARAIAYYRAESAWSVGGEENE